MKICKHCDSELPEGVKFCPSCGASDFAHKCENCGTVFDNGLYCPQCGVKVGKKEKTCPVCGETYFSNACPNCGYIPNRASGNEGAYRQPSYRDFQDAVFRSAPVAPPPPPGTPKNKWVAFFLCLFFGYFGAHKFYEGRTGMGILYLCTVGLFTYGWLIDIFILLAKPNPYYVVKK